MLDKILDDQINAKGEKTEPQPEKANSDFNSDADDPLDADGNLEETAAQPDAAAPPEAEVEDPDRLLRANSIGAALELTEHTKAPDNPFLRWNRETSARSHQPQAAHAAVSATTVVPAVPTEQSDR